MIVCTVCNSNESNLSITTPNCQYQFIKNVYCFQCNKTYIHCSQCNLYESRTTSHARDKLTAHIRYHTLHNENNPPPNDNNNIPFIDDNNNTTLYEIYLSNDLNFSEESSINYLKAISDSNNNALEHIVKSSLTEYAESHSILLDSTSDLFEKLIKLHLVSSVWVNRLSKRDREYFCEFITNLNDCFPDSVKKILYYQVNIKILGIYTLMGRNLYYQKFLFQEFV